MTEIDVTETMTIDININEEVLLKGVLIIQNVCAVPFHFQDTEFEDGDNGFERLPHDIVVFSEPQDIYIKSNDVFNQRLQVSNKEF